MAKFYVVWTGLVPGIYSSWANCKSQVNGFKGAKYKSFPTKAEAEEAYAGGASSQSAPITVESLSTLDIANLAQTVLIFTDGACNPNPGESASGMAVYRDKEISELWYGLYDPNGTNNTAELNALCQAMYYAAEELALGNTIAILADSMYSIQCMTDWAVGWKSKGWKKSDGQLIKNPDLIQKMYSVYLTICKYVTIYHVKGHAQIEGNELADRMSLVGIDECEPNFVLFPSPIDIEEILASYREDK